MDLTTRGTDDTDDVPPLRLLLFRLEREQYALPLPNVRAVMRHRVPTPVPGAPPMLPGIISQRGAILPVVELRALLGLTEAALTSAARFVLVQHDEVEMALMVEEVFDLADVPGSALESVPVGLDPARAALLRGVVQHAGMLVALLDLDSLIARLRQDGG